jgi:formate hydrogenlyase subunit 3/multisubunit Na+/H+ antiporter MnhD subunit
MIELQYAILLPIAAGIFLFIFPERLRVIKGVAAVLVSGIVLFYSYRLFRAPSEFAALGILPGFFGGEPGIGDLFMFNLDSLGRLIALFVGFFGLMLSLYSLPYITKEKRVTHYYSYFLITVGASIGAALSDHLFLFVTFWGVLGLTLYQLIKGYDEESSAAAKKSFILIGASDSIMIFGVGLLWTMAGTLRISEISLETKTALEVIAFVTLLVASLAKAGAFPLHSWVPDYAENAPASSSALLPASLDKLLGIYLLARICGSLFSLNEWLHLALLIIGGITTITAVLMALVQHNYKRLLGYHAVSQVGYMVTGFGLGSPIGIAGGLFHMVNHALYKSGLFLTAGSVEKSTGKKDLEELGGLSRAMPLTFIAALACALSISGVPPFNGFASKWIIYQGIIELGKSAGAASRVWMVWLILAVFGSALTLASFVKFISGIFLGRIRDGVKNAREVSVLMWLPQVVIAILCAAFGIAGTLFVVPTLIVPISGQFPFVGIWAANTVTWLVIISMAIGFILSLLGKPKRYRTTEGFMGGEIIRDETAYASTEFYKTIGNFKIFAFFYKNAEKKIFDLYDNTKNLILNINTAFSKGHSGLLPLYTLWVVLGLLAIFVVLLVT